jgi:protein SCO1/2
MDLKLGKEYQIVTISFDHTEKPELAREKRENYVKQLNPGIDVSGWRFFTGDSANIRKLTNEAGFYFERSGRDWIHAGGLIVLSPAGKTTRYLYGIQHLPFDVKMALVEAAEGKAMPTIAKVLKFCYSYDPEGRKYTFNFLRISAVAVVGLVAIFVVVFIVRPRKKTAGNGEGA